jgi:dihydrofolate reductase
MGEFMGKPFDLILGGKTYEIFAAHWPYSNEPVQISSTMRKSMLHPGHSIRLIGITLLY